LALFRGKDRNLYHRNLRPAAFWLLERLMRGAPLVPACEAVSLEHPVIAEELASETGNWFGEWGRLGWVIDVVV
jgi:hypothetical protein